MLGKIDFAYVRKNWFGLEFHCKSIFPRQNWFFLIINFAADIYTIILYKVQVKKSWEIFICMYQLSASCAGYSPNLLIANYFFVFVNFLFSFKWSKRKTNTLMAWGSNLNEEMAHRETILRLANESADQRAPIWWAYVGFQIEKLQKEHQSIGSGKIQLPLSHHYSIGLDWKKISQFSFLNFHFCSVLYDSYSQFTFRPKDQVFNFYYSILTIRPVYKTKGYFGGSK